MENIVTQVDLGRMLKYNNMINLILFDPVRPNIFRLLTVLYKNHEVILQNRTVHLSNKAQKTISSTSINGQRIGQKKISTACIRSIFWHFVSPLYLVISTKKDKNRDILVLLSRIFYHYEYVNVRNLNLALLMKFLHLFNCCSLETPSKPWCKES